MERRQEGKELAKQKLNFQEGRPNKFNQQQIYLAMNLLKNNSYKEVEKMTKISKNTLIHKKRKLAAFKRSENRGSLLRVGEVTKKQAHSYNMLGVMLLNTL